MQQTFAAEGGYQIFTLGTSEWFWLIFAAAVAVVAVIVGYAMMQWVLARDAGTEKMGEIADAVHEGAMAYIKRQFRTILIIVVPLAAPATSKQAISQRKRPAVFQATSTPSTVKMSGTAPI